MNMSISMWNIHSWLQSRNISHTCSIRSNNAQITGIHVQSDEPPPSGHALLAEASEHSDYNTMLSFRDDYIFFRQLTVMEALDEINYMFSIYHYWQQSLKRINLAHGSLKELLALSYEIIPYPILIFRGSELLAFAPRLEKQCLELWNYFSSMSLNEMFNLIKQDSAHHAIYEEPTPTMMHSQLFHGRQIILTNLRVSNGQYVRIAAFANGQALSAGHIQIMIELTNAILCNLTIWRHRTSDSSVNPADYFLSCSSKKYHENEAASVLYRLGWNQRDRFTVFRFETVSRQHSILTDKLCQLLKRRFPSSYCVVDNYTVHMICNLEQSEDIPSGDFVLNDLPPNCFVVSQSNISSDFSLISQLIQQTENTMSKARMMNRSFLSSSSFVMDYLSKFFLQKPDIQALIHPALLALMHKDACHPSGYYVETLRAYLFWGGNCTAASKYLNIHRSTFISRIEKIQAITGLYLDDPRVRESLQLSLLITA